MHSDRLVRTLLRLYPRPWRGRYGDEFLALVADTGLSWRAAADVVIAASVERVRTIAALLDDDGDAPITQQPDREAFAEVIGFAVFVVLLVVILGAMGVPYPRWLWWIQIFGLAGLGRLSPDLTLGSWFDRASARFVTFARCVALAGLAWLAGFALRLVGVPEPQPGLFFALVGVFIVLAAVRWTYLFVRPQLNFSKWPVMGAIEAGLWKSISFGILLATALVDAYGEAFWDVAFIIWMSRGFIGPVTSQGVARRRAQHESIFGPH